MNHQRHDGEQARRRILEAIDMLSAQYGTPPTIREVMEAAGLTSTGHVSYHIDRLRRDGRLDSGFAGRSRGLVRTGGASRSRDAAIDECMAVLDGILDWPAGVLGTMSAQPVLMAAYARIDSLKGRRS